MDEWLGEEVEILDGGANGWTRVRISVVAEDGKVGSNVGFVPSSYLDLTVV